MLAKIFSATTVGLEGVVIEVEVDVASRGFPTFAIVGLPSKAIDEAKDRVRSALMNTQYEMPDSRLTINLAPADIPKDGSGFDLPIAIGILAASGKIDNTFLGSSVFLGELSLEGKVRKVPGMISIGQMAVKKGFKNLFLPRANVVEGLLIDGITIYPVDSLSQLVLFLNGLVKWDPLIPTDVFEEVVGENEEFDFADIKGQEQAKRAMEIAAAGMHNVHLKGPPGTGKTLLSRAFPSLLPSLQRSEVLEVAAVYSLCGLMNRGYLHKRPFRSPHHTTSRIGLIGGGSSPNPGEISLAHRGVLFLDELPEFPRSVLESLRQPLEDGVVTISRASGSLTFPARFLLVAASNPCPCGYLGHPKRSCRCLPGSILKYKKKLSGPLLDRIDLHVDVSVIDEAKLTDDRQGEKTVAIRSRVLKAYARQQSRFKGTRIASNAQMTSADIKKFCHLSPEVLNLLKQAINRLSLSARSYFKIIKVAQTIADIQGSSRIEASFVAEALQYRAKED